LRRAPAWWSTARTAGRGRASPWRTQVLEWRWGWRGRTETEMDLEFGEGRGWGEFCVSPALRARLVGPVPRGFRGLSPASHSLGRHAPGKPTGPFGGMRDNGSASVPPPTRGSHSASRDVGKEFRGPRRTATATEPKDPPLTSPPLTAKRRRLQQPQVLPPPATGAGPA
jgi:hypothetical protein